jgi:arsenate reductase
VKVLFMCTANSCRSQMAEAWARQLFPGDWSVSSAGLVTFPITDRTRTAMAEVGLDMEGQRSKPLDGFDLDDFDLVVTLSRESGQFLPRLAHPERHWRRPVVDPMGLRGGDAELRAAFAEARDRIRDIVLEARASLGGS